MWRTLGWTIRGWGFLGRGAFVRRCNRSVGSFAREDGGRRMAGPRLCLDSVILTLWLNFLRVLKLLTLITMHTFVLQSCH